jgi:hypothetical protein
MFRFLAAVMTRYILAVACCVTLTADDLPQLQQLEEKHRMFELRDLLDAPGENAAETLVYRAITNSRFGREREAVRQFRAFFATNPAPEMERKARYELSSVNRPIRPHWESSAQALQNGRIGRLNGRLTGPMF